MDNTALNICYVLKRYPRFSETFIVNEILALEAQGAIVHVLALKPATEGVFHENLARVSAAVTYLPLTSQSPKKFLKSITAAKEQFGIDNVGAVLNQEADELELGIVVAEHAMKNGADVIHAHFATAAASVARIAYQLCGIPYTVTAHAKDIYHRDVDPQALNQRLTDAAHIITVSDFNKAYLDTAYPCCRNKITRIYNGMHLHQLPVRGARTPKNRLVAVGRLIEKKGFKYLIQAVAVLANDLPGVRCDIIGDGPLRSELEILSQELGVSKHICFHGLLPQHRVHQLMLEADAFVAPCVVSQDGDRDGLPTVLLEAMAIGTPCIATAVTGIPEIVRHQETGLLVDERNPIAIAEAARLLLSNMGLSLAISKAARSLVESHFNIKENTAQLLHTWRSINHTTAVSA